MQRRKQSIFRKLWNWYFPRSQVSLVGFDVYIKNCFVLYILNTDIYQYISKHMLLCTFVYVIHLYVLIYTYKWSNAGQTSGWRFIKFHMLRHIPLRILMYGWWENCSCQAGEHCHKFYLKAIKHLTNNKEKWHLQIFNIHKRRQAMKEIADSFTEEHRDEQNQVQRPRGQGLKCFYFVILHCVVVYIILYWYVGLV